SAGGLRIFSGAACEAVPAAARRCRFGSALDLRGFRCAVCLFPCIPGRYRGPRSGTVNQMTVKRVLFAIPILALAGGLFYFYGGHSTPPGQPPFAELESQSLASVESAFNAAGGQVRVLLLVSPTWGDFLAGASAAERRFGEVS